MSETEASDSMSIAIVGMAGRFPGADDVAAFWSNLREGRESITFFRDEDLDPDHVDPSALEHPDYVKAAGVLEGEDLFAADFFEINPKEAEITDPQQRLLLETAWHALENAGYDPETHVGNIGVFAGVGMNTYFLHNVLSRPEIFRSTPTLQLMIGADKDYVAPRLSYKLNLKGPSVSVQSACSTSLIAVHLACQSLRDFESDLALAGGCSLRVPQRTGYWYQEGSIFSPDGHCRAFDAGAQGTVAGSGVGVVALKRLEDARQAGDQILAVIRGSAINNDGPAKVGFTAPSVEGQVAVISEALAVADVDPGTIDFVETHGTGTTLGDPIEAEALAQAFTDPDESREEPCFLGAVKTNVGHLDTAAGVTGLIKATLALHHREIPPTLHFNGLHPDIDFGDVPFAVNAERLDWPRPEGRPRRAGVSSFGIGGSNAHVVLEEAPAPETSEASDTDRPWQILTLSARTKTALETLTDSLAEHLESQDPASGQSLADIAYTGRVGRRRFEHRRFLVCRDRDDAVRALRDRDPQRLRTSRQEARQRAVAFLFPGQGSQHPGMGKALYDREPVVREWIDRAAEILEPRLGLDLRDLLFGEGEEAAARLRSTELAQPALYATEYALARMWQQWGIEPTAMIGHSIGEYVAATVAGVMRFEDGLRLVATRGRLMASLPTGAMLAAPITGIQAAELTSGTGLSIAAVNGPTFHVLSGPEEAVEEIREELLEDGVEARRLHTSHAFHSSMMDPILDEFTAEVAKVELSAPNRPFLSNSSGHWITAEEATDPGYWARHLRQTVRFGQGLAHLLKDPATILLEVGPGRALSTLARQHSQKQADQMVLSSLEAAGKNADPAAETATEETLGRLWMAGVAVDWAGHAAGERKRVALPGYPFERQRYWIEARPRGEGAGAPAAGFASAAAAPEAKADPLAGSVHARPDLGTEYVAARNPTEEKLTSIWREALSLREIGVYDDFFELGGHSLLATHISSRARQIFSVDLSINDLFASPTIAEMAKVVEKAQAEGKIDDDLSLPAIVPDPRSKSELFPLTDVQQAYWIGRDPAYELGGVATHVYTESPAVDLDVERLAGAWRRLIDRHDMLRAIVLAEGRQQILESVPPFTVTELDLRGRSVDEQRAELTRLRQEMSQQVLPADTWPLFEVRVSHLDDQRSLIHTSFDLLIGDAWSWQILNQELKAFYDQPDLQLGTLELSFRDYVEALVDLERSPAFARDFEYWRERLVDFPAAPDLPLAVQPASLGKPRFARLADTLDAERWGRLKARAREEGLTPSGLLVTAFADVLSTWSKSPRFALNLTLFNRLPLHREVNALIGDFTSLTLLVVDPEEASTFLGRARQMQRQLWEDLDHRLVSAVRVLRELARARRLPAQPMMPVVFTSTLNMASGSSEEPRSADEAAPNAEESFGISQTPQVWIDHQVNEDRGALFFNWDVVEDLFPEGLLQDMFATYRSLLERLADDDSVWQLESPVGAPAAQLAQRSEVNATSAPEPAERLQDLFAAQVEKRPEALAVVAGETRLTYADLARRTRALALQLQELGAAPGRLVAVSMVKGWEQAVATLGVLQAGAAYLPIDPELPEARRHFLLENGETDLVLTQSSLLESVRWPESARVIAVDTVEPADTSEPLPAVPGGEELAYVIFTSGSTGNPKGVMIDHRGAVNTVLDVNERFAIGPDDRVLALSSLSFDLSVYDLFGLFAAGGAVVFPDPELRRDPPHWAELIASHGVTVWNTVPALQQLLVEYLEESPRSDVTTLRTVLMSGDWIPVSLPARIQALWPAARQVSMGGATEASIWSILHLIDPASAADQPSIPYGRPMRNQTFHVLDHRLEPCPVWVPGQLFIGGIGLARGYWRDEEKTAASFLTHPETGERLYRTGDLGRYLADGEIQFLGREDLQVKIRGYRVELGEIEAALVAHEGVREAVVSVFGGPTAGAGAPEAGAPAARLVAYTIAEDPAAPPTSEELETHLKGHLPDYMVPSSYTEMQRWPLTANGKLDRAALPTPEGLVETEREFRPPETETEETLLELWREVTGVEELGVLDDFFENGGDSLMATRLTFRIRKDFEVELPVRTFFDHPTVAQLALVIEEMILEEIEALSDEKVQELL